MPVASENFDPKRRSAGSRLPRRVAGLAHDLEAGPAVDEHAEPFADELVVFDEGDAYLCI